MLRLTALLCVTMFLTLLIGGRDYGQQRPGLAAALLTAVDAPAAQPVAPPDAVQDVVPAAYLPRSPQVVTPQIPAPVFVATPAPAPAAAATPVWYVTAGAVNVREGPSTDYAVVGRLTRGEAALVVWHEDDGWARIRIEGDGIEGFVATRFLAPESAPGN
ncbi:SH3 domain-containing protein [Paracoccaceae bacterium Fryx2]|nr:SH3 domain-containing protein [Paracoccaceae bacterium Fryx2]